VRLSPSYKKSTTQTANEPIEKITTCISSTGEVREIDFCEYLKGVVSAEMPASFHEEALKAQAIAARSYILARMQGYMRDGTPDEHNGAMTCDDPAHCKAWTSTEKLKEQWGDSFDFYWDKISSCTEQTKGIVMTYDGALVNAVFHSTSSGFTENAKDVWGGDIPYLASVKSEGDSLSPKYNDSVTLSVDEYKKLLTNSNKDLIFRTSIIGSHNQRHYITNKEGNVLYKILLTNYRPDVFTIFDPFNNELGQLKTSVFDAFSIKNTLIINNEEVFKFEKGVKDLKATYKLDSLNWKIEENIDNNEFVIKSNDLSIGRVKKIDFADYDIVVDDNNKILELSCLTLCFLLSDEHYRRIKD